MAVTGACALAAILLVALAAIAVRRFATHPRNPPAHRPPVTVLKPLCGDEPMLEAALATICGQDYPELQIVFGVQDAADPALIAVRAVRQRFPGCDITVVVDHDVHGPNRKISNLMNMLPAARHDLLVLSDSDLHVPSDYIEQIVAALDRPGIGLVTTLCTGLPTRPGLVARLGATAITHSFLPGALMSRTLGRQDCLGTTMALRRDILAQIGGLDALVEHVADDNVLGQRVRQAGLGIGLAAVVPMTGVPEHSLGALFEHEVRWARTIRALEPALFVTSTLQFPLFWTAALVLLTGGAAWAAGLFGAAWLVRVAAALAVDRALQPRPRRAAVPALLLPMRDLLSVGIVAAGYLGGRVVWRGRVLHVDAPRRALSKAQPKRTDATPALTAHGVRGGSLQSAGTGAVNAVQTCVRPSSGMPT
jgi:ceramide glucosyltransferase